MKEYRKEHQRKDGRLYVYIWVCSGPGAASATFKPTDAKPMHMIWKGVDAMEVEASTVDGARLKAKPLDIEIRQLDPGLTRDQALDWIDNDGKQWANGRTCRLVEVSLHGRGPQNDVLI